MSWSLRLHNGDFSLSGAQLDVVSNEAKLTQDLRCGLLSPLGMDLLHPEYGSTIDGGVTAEGNTVDSIVGQSPSQVTSSLNAEIQRIARNYQAQQLARAQDDKLIYNRISLTPAEVLISLSNVEFVQHEDALQVTVSLETAAGEDINVVFSLAPNS